MILPLERLELILRRIRARGHDAAVTELLNELIVELTRINNEQYNLTRKMVLND